MANWQQRVLRALATWWGCGKSPRAPGTMGTLGAIPLYWMFAQLSGLGYMAATVLFVGLAIIVAQLYEVVLADRHDSPELVIDEVAGFLVTMTWLPLDAKWICAGFLLFRLLDVFKPFPISWVDRRVPGGVGAVADDLVAGMFANVALQALLELRWL